MIGLGQMQLSSVLTCEPPKQTVAMTPNKVVNHNHNNMVRQKPESSQTTNPR